LSRSLMWGVMAVRAIMISSSATWACLSLSCAVHHDSLAMNGNQILFFQGLQYASGHFPRAIYQPTQLLPGNLDLHAVGMCHGIGFLAKFYQSSGDSTSHIVKGKVANLAGRVA